MRTYRALGVAVTKYSCPAYSLTMRSTTPIYAITSLATSRARRDRNVGDCAAPMRIHSRVLGSVART